ncbi:GNAT family N-acetyltransferase [Candidatus Poribacteria bacterium]|nr:GNAT family N-acetyltransferase [Candidatus Poribacteria bacterium]
MANGMRCIERSERRRLAPLFEATEAPRTVVACVVQGHGGVLSVDDVAEPRVAHIKLGPFAILAGDAEAPAARAAIAALPPWAIVLGPSAEWGRLILAEHPRASLGRRTSFTLRDRDADALQAMVSRVPAGCRVERIDLRLARRIGDEVDGALIFPPVFEDPEDFVARSVGYCAVERHSIVAGATAAVPYDGGFGIQVNTNETRRGNGLATAVSAALILHALREGVEPHWDTASVVSAGLARKLGYAPTGTYDTVALRG